MELEFDCGTVAHNVGELVLALKHHLTVCADAACNEDVKTELAKYGKNGFVLVP